MKFNIRLTFIEWSLIRKDKEPGEKRLGLLELSEAADRLPISIFMIKTAKWNIYRDLLIIKEASRVTVSHVPSGTDRVTAPGAGRRLLVRRAPILVIFKTFYNI